MPTITKQWQDGSGEVTVTYNGSGDGTISVASDANNLSVQRSMQIVIQTTAGSPQVSRTVTIVQGGKPSETPNFILRDGSYYCFRDGSLLNVKIPNANVSNGTNEANGS